jgi:hypothetical protein
MLGGKRVTDVRKTLLLLRFLVNLVQELTDISLSIERLHATAGPAGRRGEIHVLLLQILRLRSRAPLNGWLGHVVLILRGLRGTSRQKERREKASAKDSHHSAKCNETHLKNKSNFSSPADSR